MDLIVVSSFNGIDIVVVVTAFTADVEDDDDDDGIVDIMAGAVSNHVNMHTLLTQ